MGAEWMILPVLAVIFLATLIRSAFGFGEALVAVPLLVLLMPVEEAVPLATLVSITVAGIVVAQDWQKMHARSTGWLVISTLLGIPVGLWLLTAVPETVVKAILAVVLIGFSSYGLVRRSPYQLEDDRWAWVFGLGAGVLGGAYGMNGPPLVLYGSLRQWSPEQFRATLQGYFLPASLLGLCGYWLAGLWTPAVTRYYLWSLPLALAAIFLGRALNRRMRGRSFLRSLHVGLLLVGTVLLIQYMR
ncbi:MAG: sulfite exporter TauE/SafE family protein [Gemmataceae bacterium]|nr:sulfite exporter TauE/SafE family protein [Gemmataceae bacterium]